MFKKMFMKVLTNQTAGVFSKLAKAGVACGVAAAIGLSSMGAAHAFVPTVDVLERVQQVAQNEENRGNQVLFISVDHVSRNSAKKQGYFLDADAKYRVWAVGDNGHILDIDLNAYRGNSTAAFVADEDDQNTALIQFNVTVAGQHSFEVKPYKMAAGTRDGFYGLVIVRVDE